MSRICKATHETLKRHECGEVVVEERDAAMVPRVVIAEREVCARDRLSTRGWPDVHLRRARPGRGDLRPRDAVENLYSIWRNLTSPG